MFRLVKFSRPLQRTIYWTGIPGQEWVFDDSPACRDVATLAKCYPTAAERDSAIAAIQALYATRGTVCQGLTWEVLAA